MLRQVKVAIASRKPAPQVCNEAEPPNRLPAAGERNAAVRSRIRQNDLRLEAELSLEKQILRDVANGNYSPLSGNVTQSGMPMRCTNSWNGLYVWPRERAPRFCCPTMFLRIQCPSHPRFATANSEVRPPQPLRGRGVPHLDFTQSRGFRSVQACCNGVPHLRRRRWAKPDTRTV